MKIQLVISVSLYKAEQQTACQEAACDQYSSRRQPLVHAFFSHLAPSVSQHSPPFFQPFFILSLSLISPIPFWYCAIVNRVIL
ncbi:hypothetical protein L6452_30621 [Arctium lappa]|uniref:Uncharacterized protein n=1 Tax=Arctium lappa TaxID=4217 RepID=A0ACB8ZIS3_ARCLA|nr:hypothetical protein L6452_30621 [Arctium lappa]